MLEGLQEDCDAVMLVGYHAMAGASGVLAHTMSGLAFHRVWLNGRPVGEVALYALLAGEHGVPVVLCSGDDALAGEVAHWLPNAHRVVVKSASGNRAAISVSPARSAQLIAAGAKQALKDLPQATPLTMAGTICCRVEAKTLVQADLFAMLPRSRRTDPLTVEFDAAAASEVLGVLTLWAAAASTL
jgi:D-amino peptidase